jgi:hypothetical protein
VVPTDFLKRRGVITAADSFATLEHELLADADFAGPREAHLAGVAFIDDVVPSRTAALDL